MKSEECLKSFRLRWLYFVKDATILIRFMRKYLEVIIKSINFAMSNKELHYANSYI